MLPKGFHNLSFQMISKLNPNRGHVVYDLNNVYTRCICLITSSLYSSTCIFTMEEKEECIERLKKIKMPSYPSPDKLRNAAVLIPLCCVDGEPAILYTLRKSDLKRHKGQVSFPGGKHDEEDSNLERTALRETEEELGISQSSIEVWGHGNTVSAREFNILPVVGYIGDIVISSLKPNPSEVELAFTVPLKHFYNNLNCRYTQYRQGGGYILPVYIMGDLKIWGITALITHIVLRSLAPKKYKFELNFIKPVSSSTSVII